jgi:hypothetical protein
MLIKMGVWNSLEPITVGNHSGSVAVYTHNKYVGVFVSL